MPRLAWMTDIHLNFLTDEEIDGFCATISATEADVVLVAGDIGEAPSVGEYLCRLATVGLPVYFVLGNHDYYGASIASVRQQMGKLAAREPALHWLVESGVVELSADTALIGHGCWADGRLGDYEGSRIMLNDYVHIAELAGLNKQQRLRQLQALGDEAAEHISNVLLRAFESASQVVLLTHVPPFRDACWYRGRASSAYWLPHFGCQVVGERLRQIMSEHEQKQLTVLCGHCHCAGTVEILPNLVVHTGGAEYGDPQVQPVLTVP